MIPTALTEKTKDQQEMNVVLAYFIEVNKDDRGFLSREEEYELAEMIQKYGIDSPQGERARNLFISTNLKLVVHFAKRYRNRGLPLSDLIQEGNLGLMRAVPKFNHKKGQRFGTYASWWIKQAIRRAIVNQGKVVRLPAHVNERLDKLRKTRKCLALKSDNPSIEKVAKVAGVPVRLAKEAIEIQKGLTHIISLEERLGESDSPFSSILPGGSNVGYKAEMEDFMMQIRFLLRKIPRREAEIVYLRVMRDMHLEEVGRIYGISRERVRQVQNRAFRRLRELMLFGVEQTKKDGRGRKPKKPAVKLEGKRDYPIQGQIQISKQLLSSSS